MKFGSCIFGAMLLAAAMGFSTALAAEDFHRTPERLEYNLLWAGVKAGTATLGIENGMDGGMLLRSTARSEDWVSVFYPVKDLVETMVASTGYPARYSMSINEGATHKDREYIFFDNNVSVRYVDKILKKEDIYNSAVPVYDPLSAFDRVRWGALPESGSVRVDMFDSRKFSVVEVRILGRETVTVPAGTFDTIKIQPVLKSEGIFSSRGDIFVWVTDDSRRIPVRLLTKVLVGTISADLTAFSRQ